MQRMGAARRHDGGSGELAVAAAGASARARAGAETEVDGTGRADGAAAHESVEDAYRRMRPALVRLAYLVTGHLDLAEDAVHDAFVACSLRWSTLARPDGYVRRAVVNHARTALRRAGRERDKADRLGHAVPLTVGQPELDETWSVLRGLPERQRVALVLRFYEDLSEAEIARALDCRPGTVKSLVHRGLARVRKETGR
jgi:RNA polymerase sigma factor (sigma-70 family)